MADIFEKWQPNPSVVTAVKVSVEDVPAIRDWIQSITEMPTKETVSYQRGNEIIIDWSVKYRPSFSTMVGDYLVLGDNREFRVIDEEHFKKEFVRITSAVSLESEEGSCSACGQDTMRFKGDIWHVHTGRVCPGLMRSVSPDDIFIPNTEGAR
jgi:hypothetical protein